MQRFSGISRFGALAFLLLVVGALSTCGSASTGSSPTATSGPPVTLNVFAAASLTNALNDIGKQFHTAHPNVTVTWGERGVPCFQVWGGSAVLFA